MSVADAIRRSLSIPSKRRCQIVTFEQAADKQFIVHRVPFSSSRDHIVSRSIRAPRRGAVTEIPSMLEDVE